VVREIVSEAMVRRLNDPRVEPLTTITRVEMVGDLEIARIYLAIPGGDAAERRTLRAIRHARGFLQRIVAGEMSIRQCPIIEFEVDDAAKKARETLNLIAENRRRNPEVFADDVPDRASIVRGVKAETEARVEPDCPDRADSPGSADRTTGASASLDNPSTQERDA